MENGKNKNSSFLKVLSAEGAQTNNKFCQQKAHRQTTRTKCSRLAREAYYHDYMDCVEWSMKYFYKF